MKRLYLAEMRRGGVGDEGFSGVDELAGADRARGEYPPPCGLGERDSDRRRAGPSRRISGAVGGAGGGGDGAQRRRVYGLAAEHAAELRRSAASHRAEHLLEVVARRKKPRVEKLISPCYLSPLMN